MLCMAPMATQAQLDTNAVVLPQCKTFNYPHCYITDDCVYHEFYPEDSLVSRFEYTVTDSKRIGPLKIYNKEGKLVAQGSFRKNQLKDGILTIYEGEDAQNIELIYDAPGWFLASHWTRRSGTQECEGENHFVWLAGQRYRLPAGVAELNF